MATREYQFIVGPETSTIPTVGTPSVDTDILTLGFADDRYTQGGEAVADVTALKAIAASERRDGDYVLVKSTNNVYRFDSASSLSGDDNFVATPSAGTGRWIRVTILNRQNTFTDTTQSSSKDTGCAVFEGGIGVEKNLYVGGNVNISGDLTVDGTTTTLNTQTLDVEDANITVNKNGTVASANAAVSGITVDTDVTDARIGYDSSLASRFKAGDVGSESEVMTTGTAQTVSGVKTFSDNVVLDNAKKLVFEELNASGNNYVSLKAPDSLSANVEFTLPSADGTFEQVLSTNASGQLSFITVPTTTLNQYHIKVGNASNVETPVNTNTTGDISADSTNGFNIKTGVIINADVNASAGIQFSKLEALTSGQVLIGDGSNIATPRTISGDITVDNTGVASISSGAVVNADVNASAGIQFSKLESLSSARLVVGSGANVPTAVDVTGDVTISNTGVTAIGSGVIVNADVNASAGISYSKLALSGSIVNADVNASAAIEGSKIVSATDSVSGVVTTAAQSFAGIKTFKASPVIHDADGQSELAMISTTGSSRIKFIDGVGSDRLIIGVDETAGATVTGSSAQDSVIRLAGGGRRLLFSAAGTSIQGMMDSNGNWTFGTSGIAQSHVFPAASGERKTVTIGNTSTSYPGIGSSDICLLRLSSNSDTFVQFEDRSQAVNLKKMAIRQVSGSLRILAQINDADNDNKTVYYVTNSGMQTHIGPSDFNNTGDYTAIHTPHVVNIYSNAGVAQEPLLISKAGDGGNSRFIRFVTGGTQLTSGANARGSIKANAGNTALDFEAFSDFRLKRDIKSIENGLEKITALNPVTFTWKETPSEVHGRGFIAQEVKEIIPEAVSIDGPEETHFYSMGTSEFIPLLVSAIKTLSSKVDDLQKEITLLKNL